jgi:hypothetical protein
MRLLFVWGHKINRLKLSNWVILVWVRRKRRIRRVTVVEL